MFHNSQPSISWVAEVIFGRDGEQPPVAQTDVPAGYQAIYSLLAIPTIQKPYALLPSDRRAASESIKDLGNPVHRSARLAERALGIAFQTGVVQQLVDKRVYFSIPTATRSPEFVDLLDHLGSVFGRRDISIAVILGRERPNRKPILRIMTPDGLCLGFAKIGFNDVSRPLVASEARTLRRLAKLDPPPRTFRVPAVLDYRRHGENEVLLLSPLPRPPVLERSRLQPPLDAARELAALTGTETDQLLRSRYWRSLKERVMAVADDTPSSRLLGHGIDLVEAEFGAREMLFGSWHGDWIPWNMCHAGGVLHIWDWERFKSPAPVGLDVARFDFDVRVKIRKEMPRRAIHRSALDLGPFLEAAGAPSGNARAYAILHLIEMVLRYQESATAGVLVADTNYATALNEALQTRLR